MKVSSGEEATNIFHAIKKQCSNSDVIAVRESYLTDKLAYKEHLSTRAPVAYLKKIAMRFCSEIMSIFLCVPC